jgi:hypothetical protein
LFITVYLLFLWSNIILNHHSVLSSTMAFSEIIGNRHIYEIIILGDVIMGWCWHQFIIICSHKLHSYPKLPSYEHSFKLSPYHPIFSHTKL